MPTKAMRFNTDKLPISMVMEAIHAIEGAASVLSFGAKKYERSNWQKGLDKNEIIDSMMRHLLTYMSGEEIDEDSGCNHLDHILCNAIFLANQYNGRQDAAIGKSRDSDKTDVQPTTEQRGDSVRDVGANRRSCDKASSVALGEVAGEFIETLAAIGIGGVPSTALGEEGKLKRQNTLARRNRSRSDS